MSNWDVVDIRPTKMQRCTLYKLGYTRWLVSRMDRDDASRMITAALEIVQKNADRQAAPGGTPGAAE
jgi:hypothetical protein